MSDCLRDDELARVAADPGAPGRAHAETCPRCRARLLAWREFERPVEPADAAGHAAGRERVLGAVRSELGLERSEPVVTPLPSRPRRARPRWERLLAVAAAVVVVAGGSWLAWRGFEGPHPGEPPRIERGEPAGGALSPAEPEAGPDGVRFRWRAVGGADGYVVRVLGADMRVLHESAAVRETTLLLAPEHAAPPRPGEAIYWEIAALRGGETLETTAPRALGSVRRR